MQKVSDCHLCFLTFQILDPQTIRRHNLAYPFFYVLFDAKKACNTHQGVSEDFLTAFIADVHRRTEETPLEEKVVAFEKAPKVVEKHNSCLEPRGRSFLRSAASFSSVSSKSGPEFLASKASTKGRPLFQFCLQPYKELLYQQASSLYY